MVEKARQRIVVLATPQQKKNIMSKAEKLNLPVSELMRRSAAAYSSEDAYKEIEVLADQAKLAATRIAASIDEAATFVEASQMRIERMEAEAAAIRVSEGA